MVILDQAYWCVTSANPTCFFFYRCDGDMSWSSLLQRNAGHWQPVHAYWIKKVWCEMEISPGPEWGCYVLYYSLTSLHLGESSLTYTVCRQASTLNNYLSRYEKRPLSYCRLYCIPTLCLNDNIVFLSLCSHCSFSQLLSLYLTHNTQSQLHL